MVRALEAGGDWSLQFPEGQGLRCYAILNGSCWLIETGGPPLRLTAGDCVLLTRGRPSRLASDPNLPPLDAVAILGAAEAGGLVKLGDAPNCSGLGGYFAFQGPQAGLLLELLPPLVHIRKAADRAALRSRLELIMEELRTPQPGGALIAEHLAQMVLVQALRLNMTGAAPGAVGWLYALGDRQLSVALTALHAHPGRRWTLQTLAETAGMSRSSFAQKFRATVGMPAMDYLGRWRMLLAADRLTQGRDPISVIAADLGYESESAFSVAFKRVMACSPRRYGRGARERNGP
jgi:AraC-like DNA-binding protein